MWRTVNRQQQLGTTSGQWLTQFYTLHVSRVLKGLELPGVSSTLQCPSSVPNEESRIQGYLTDSISGAVTLKWGFHIKPSSTSSNSTISFCLSWETTLSRLEWAT